MPLWALNETDDGHVSVDMCILVAQLASWFVCQTFGKIAAGECQHTNIQAVLRLNSFWNVGVVQIQRVSKASELECSDPDPGIGKERYRV